MVIKFLAAVVTFIKNKMNIIIDVAAIGGLLIVAWTLYLRIVEGYIWADWTGFGEYTGPLAEDQRVKTLWDLMELLIIPAVLGVGALLFNKAMRDRELEIATDRQRETALQNYLDKIAELLLEENLKEKKDTKKDPVLDVAQTRTVTTLRILDTARKNIVFQFLRDAGIANYILMGSSLKNADFRNTNMSLINLSKSNLQKANLRKVNLSGSKMNDSDLHDANLYRADLRFTNLTRANLMKADLTAVELSDSKLIHASLNEANLQRADLMAANLNHADLTDTDLSAACLGGADLESVILFQANLRMTDLRLANLFNADMRRVNLQRAKIKDAQLGGTSRLNGAILPNGKKYNGRFNLRDDILYATNDGIDINNSESLARWYGVSLEDYLSGQEWAKENLPKFRDDKEQQDNQETE